MIVPLPSRAIGAAALAAGLLLAGCSSDSDVPQTVASAPGGGTQVNTDTGSAGDFPDVNTVPNQRPTSTIQDLNLAPQGLSGASNGTQYGEPLVGGPSSSAERPAPPPPPEPAPEEQLPPIPEAGVQTQSSSTPTPEAAPEATAAEAPAAAEPPYTEEVPVAEETPVTEEAPVSEQAPVAEESPVAEEAPVSDPEPVPTPEVATPEVATPEIAEPAPQPEAVAEAVPEPVPGFAEPDNGSVETTPISPGGVQAATTPQPSAPPPYNPPQAMYGSPNASAPANYGMVVASSQSAAVAPTPVNYGPPAYVGQPVGLIFFQDGSSELSSDDRPVLKEIAEIHHTYGGIIHVIGHASMGSSTTDFESHQQANQRISEARAEAVARQLIEYGVPIEAIQTAAAGDSQPLYSESAPSGEAGNRRAEVYLSAY